MLEKREIIWKHGNRRAEHFHKAYSFYKANSTEKRQKIFRVYIKLYQHGSQPMSVQDLQMLLISQFRKDCSL